MRKWLSKVLARDFITFWIIATISFVGGLLVNEFRNKPLPLKYLSKNERFKLSTTTNGTDHLFSSKSSTLSKELTLEEFKVFVGQKRGLVLDARSEVFHRLGHVPGALSLPRDDFESGYAKLKPRLEQNKNQPLVVYCSSFSCEDSQLVQTALIRSGFTRVMLFRGGWSAWSEAGLPGEIVP